MPAVHAPHSFLLPCARVWCRNCISFCIVIRLSPKASDLSALSVSLSSCPPSSQAIAKIRLVASHWDGTPSALRLALQPIVAPLAVQLDDLRSALVKEAAAAMAFLAQVNACECVWAVGMGMGWDADGMCWYL